MVTSKNQLHYEVFTNASESELNKFLDNEAGLFQDRKFIKLTKGSKIKTTPPEVVISAGEHTLRHDHAIATDTALIVEGNNKQAYYRMILPDGNQSVVGYHPKRDMSSPDIICQHDWRKMGFEIVEESNSNADGLMDLEEMPKFFKDLHKEIDQFGAKGRAGYGDGVITAVELKLALQNHRLRDRWSKLIAKHPSEWRKDSASIIEAMKGLLTGTKRTLKTLRIKGELKKNVELGEKVLTHEKERMKELAFWEDVSELGSPSVYHFHPIAFVGNVMGGGKITVELIDKLRKLVGLSGEWFGGNGHTTGFKNEFPTNFPNIYHINKQEFVDLLNAALNRYGITGDYHQAHFLAQCIVESAYLESTIEFASGRAYDPDKNTRAAGYGNTEVGDGPKYKGKGLIQLTWKNNYKAYSKYKGDEKTFTDNPMLIATDMYNSIDASCWFWRKHGGVSKKYNARGDINILIDNEKNNISLVTLAVNGPLRHALAHRISMFNLIKKEWGLE